MSRIGTTTDSAEGVEGADLVVEVSTKLRGELEVEEGEGSRAGYWVGGGEDELETQSEVRGQDWERGERC